MVNSILITTNKATCTLDIGFQVAEELNKKDKLLTPTCITGHYYINWGLNKRKAYCVGVRGWY